MNRTLLIFSQVYPPDPASVGQHMADVASEMARRGWRVRVITANRGYDDASVKYPPFEMRDGVEVRRVPLSSFGKKSIALRALAMMLFMVQCLWAGLTTRGVSALLVSTSPPMCGFAAAVAHSLRRIPLIYWVMDLNPDQMIELGKMRAKFPQMEHPLVCKHPETGRTMLYLNQAWTVGIKGLNKDESQAIIDMLKRHSTKDVFQARFRYRPNSLMLWDNRAVQHSPNSDYTGQRFMWRLALHSDWQPGH